LPSFVIESGKLIFVKDLHSEKQYSGNSLIESERLILINWKQLEKHDLSILKIELGK
jgi:hypothetical protein